MSLSAKSARVIRLRLICSTNVRPFPAHPVRRRPLPSGALWTPWTCRPQLIRHASTHADNGASIFSRLKDFSFGTALILGLGFVYVYVTDTRASFHHRVVIPALRLMYPDPEEAHQFGNKALKSLWHFGLHPRERGISDTAGDLSTDVFGQTLLNPIGTSAGIDKHADIPDVLFAVGPAVIEIGGTTPRPQDGNDRPRVFRLPSQNALINRYGLNSEGADHVAMRLRRRVREFAYSLGLGYDDFAEQIVLNNEAGVPPGSLIPGKLLAINIAKNKTTPPDNVKAVTEDYVYCVNRLAPYADILVVNVSSPNTPGLRTLQKPDSLKEILGGVVEAAKQTPRKTKPAVMVKVSPDEDSDDQIAGICQAVWESGVDGVIVGNTTNRRPEPLPHLRTLSPTEEQHLLEQGGFSGPHLFERTVALVKRYRKLLEERPEKPQPPARSRAALEEEAKNLRAAIDAKADPPATDILDKVGSSTDSQATPASNPSEKTESEKMPLINAPQARVYNSLKSERERLKSVLEALEQLPAKSERAITSDVPKVIFATGGITNGQQALEVLDAGASVAMVYTALVYGGIGTISRIKDEMREEIRSQKSSSKMKKKKKATV